MNTYYSGTGESLDNPILLHGVEGEKAATNAELTYLDSYLGTRGVHWFLRFRVEHQHGGRIIDEIGISAYC